MSDTTTSQLSIPGIRAKVQVEPDYDWTTRGTILANGFDAEQADALNAFARGIRALGVADGLMQIQYLADLIRGSDAEKVLGGEYDRATIIWFLDELRIRLDDMKEEKS